MKTLHKTLLVLVLTVFTSLLASPVLAEDAVWIDVRTQAEYDADHMDDTTLIPHNQIADEIGKLGLEKDAPIKLFCRSGGRAGTAKKTLEDLGYTNVENVGGIADARKVREQAE